MLLSNLNKINQELFVLLDLLGAKGPSFASSFSATEHHFKRMWQLGISFFTVGLFVRLFLDVRYHLWL